jgi:hypothetical protein
MKLGAKLSGQFRRLPAWAVVSLVFSIIIATAFTLIAILPPPVDPYDACVKQCRPLSGQIVDDKDYPMSAKGHYRQICKCF